MSMRGVFHGAVAVVIVNAVHAACLFAREWWSLRKAPTVLLLLALGACAKEPPTNAGNVPTDNPNFSVDRIFTVAATGCSVYRFEDSGENHYFAVCPNATVAMSQDIQRGAGRSRHTETEIVPTVTPKPERP